MQITKLANLALAGLIVTGPIMVWTKFGGLGKLPDPAWFWTKMAVVVVLLGVIHMGRANAKKAMGGDGAAAARQPKFALAGIVVYLSVILCAVVSFG
jgi:uncharacterized membrane protein